MGLIARQTGHVLRLTIDRQDKRNALDNAVMREMTQVLKDIDEHSSVRVVVLTGAGDKAFCAGADLGGDQDVFNAQDAQPKPVYAELIRTARDLPVPMIARVNGYCLAGGMGLLAFCDMAVASADARFGLPEVKVGLFPMQVAAILTRLIPPRDFAELSLTGELIDAERALEMRLVNYVVAAEDLDAKTDWLAARVADKSPTGIRLGKRAMRAIEDQPFEAALAHMEAQVATMPLTEDAREGLAAFREKRKPQWTGK